MACQSPCALSICAEASVLAIAMVGGAKRDRTADLLHAMQALSQLSYGPIFRQCRVPWSAHKRSKDHSRRRLLTPPSRKIKPLVKAYFGAARKSLAALKS
jgi:hypothetical protein